MRAALANNTVAVLATGTRGHVAHTLHMSSLSPLYRRQSAANPRLSGVRTVLARSAEDADETPTASPSASAQQVEIEEEPVWVKREKQRELDSQNKDLPFGVYLLFSCFVTIAAVGSCFEFANQNPIFGVVGPDSPLYGPILGLFAVTGIPTAGVLFFKGVSAANAEAERMDAMDGVASRDSVLNPRDRQ